MQQRVCPSLLLLLLLLLLGDLQNAHGAPGIHQVANYEAPTLSRCSTFLRIQQLESQAKRQKLCKQALSGDLVSWHRIKRGKETNIQMSLQAEMQEIPEMGMVKVRKDPQELGVEVDRGLRESRGEVASRLGWEHRLVLDQLVCPLTCANYTLAMRCSIGNSTTYRQDVVCIFRRRHLDLLLGRS